MIAKSLISKSLIAAAALATTFALALPASQAQAGVDVKIGIGLGGFFPGHYGHGHYGHGYYGHGNYGHGYYKPGRPVYRPGAISCGTGRNIVDRSGFNKVKAVDCRLPGYKYTAWKKGHKFVVSVNRYGNISNVNRVN